MRRGMKTKPHDVYRVFDKDRTLLYVGCSSNAFKRIQQHKYEYQAWFPSACTVDIDQYPDRVTARLVEAQSIATESPVWNVRKEAMAIFRGRGITPSPIDQIDEIPIDMFWVG